MAVTITRDDQGENKGLKIVRTWKEFNFDLLVDENMSEDIYIHQSDIATRRESIQKRQDDLDAETAKLDALEAKLTTLWQNAA